MKQKFLNQTLLILLSVGIIVLQACTNSEAKPAMTEAGSVQVPSLLNRAVNQGSDEEADRIKTVYDNCILALKNNPQDLKAYLNLASVFITEGRITGNLGYYNEAAMNMAEYVLSAKPQDKQLEFEALQYKSAILLSIHQFAQANEVALSALALSRKNAGVYGALVDANVELGNYDLAVKYCDTMINMKPDIRSYSRVSYLRQINGDNKGSIEAMTYAVNAGVPGAENTEWARVTLGDLYLNIGDIAMAKSLYNQALEHRPNYAYAYIGLAKIEMVNRQYDAAITYCENAIRVISDPSFITLLADCYALKGNKQKADEMYNDVKNLLVKAEKEQTGILTKHNGARELATAYMKTGELNKALEFALTDLQMRPANIDANELVAWLYYQLGDYTNAKMHAEKMLATNVKNANTLYKAGLIFTKAGDVSMGNTYKEQAKAVSAYIDQLLK